MLNFPTDQSGVGVLSSVCASQQCHAEFSKDESGARVVSDACESQQSHAEFSKDESDVRVVSSACESQQSHAEFSNDQSGVTVIRGVNESQQSHAEFSSDQSGVRIVSSFCEPQQSHAEFSSVQSVKFWTNGGLLGLEPSKPPDFAMSNTTGRDYVARSKFGPPNIAIKGDGQNEKLNTLIENPESSEKVSSSSIDKVPVSSADTDSKLEKSIGCYNSKRFNHGQGGGLNVTAVAASGTELPPDVKATSSETNRENDGNSSLVFELGHRLLVNGFRRKLSLVHDDKSEPVSSLETDAFDRQHGRHHDAYQRMEKMTLMEQFGHGSPLGSLTSSPPLEHMKISFKPADGFETSKLGLKFPDGSQCPESIRDMFPSFQLVPGPAIPLPEYGSDSDDDTFYRSSPYMSDDCRSHHSESNSEQWESSPEGSNHHELYDALGRMSSMGSVSSSLQVEEAAKHDMHANYGLQNVHTENGAEPCLSCLDLPSFDAMNSVLQGETKPDSEPKNLSKLLNPTEHTPLPPPLPPVEWRVSKPHSDVAEEKQYAESDSPRQALQQKCLESSMSQHPEPAPPDQPLTEKDAFVFRRESKEDQQKLNWKKEVNQKANGKGMDEKEDFLHQIRTKSFSLRPTVAARPTFPTGPAANNKVTAILEKANAIRQAVASDDGDGDDDDTWSDS
ncbi:SCAR family protein, putative isoform 2 [Melia azedarach]|uniref:SCAR family protein, putative isoform 2 n=1 Tax=Melia azedarach TaxID=155640 RepID=A0ACC1WXN1_MELAZ|nr:SCAR family protein, putative isoform 2 [Melia azedarach]